MKSLDHVNIDNENFLYFIFNKVDGYIEGNVVFTPTDENKEALKNTQNFGMKRKAKLK